MTYSLSLASRGVRHRDSGDMFASLSRDEHGAGTANIHAGSALLATGGICMLGDLSCYKKDKLDAIQSGRAKRLRQLIMTLCSVLQALKSMLTFCQIECWFACLIWLSVLESRTVSVFIPGKKYGEDVDQQLSLPVPCSFWALTNSTDNSRRFGRTDGALLGKAVSSVTTWQDIL